MAHCCDKLELIATGTGPFGPEQEACMVRVGPTTVTNTSTCCIRNEDVDPTEEEMLEDCCGEDISAEANPLQSQYDSVAEAINDPCQITYDPLPTECSINTLGALGTRSLVEECKPNEAVGTNVDADVDSSTSSYSIKDNGVVIASGTLDGFLHGSSRPGAMSILFLEPSDVTVSGTAYTDAEAFGLGQLNVASSGLAFTLDLSVLGGANQLNVHKNGVEQGHAVTPASALAGSLDPTGGTWSLNHVESSGSYQLEIDLNGTAVISSQ